MKGLIPDDGRWNMGNRWRMHRWGIAMRFDLIALLDSLRLRWREDSLEVFQDNDERFMLDSVSGFTLDLKQKTACRNGRILATFDEIENIGIRTCDGHDVPPHWKIILARIGRSDIVIGRTDDQLNGSRIAARLGTLTGKPVIVRR